MNQSIKTLEAHNAWRRGDESAPHGKPAEIGRAIDDCVQAAKRYELVRTLTPLDYKALCVRNLHGENFDVMVDELVKARAR